MMECVFGFLVKSLVDQPRANFSRLIGSIVGPHCSNLVDGCPHARWCIFWDLLLGVPVNGFHVVNELLKGHVFGLVHLTLTEEHIQQEGCLPWLNQLPFHGLPHVLLMQVGPCSSHGALKW